MKLKSYLRGLGLGMIVTTIILVLAFRAKNTEMSDEEIIARAYELGMVETSLYGSGENDTDVTQGTSGEEGTNGPEASNEGLIDPESLPGTENATTDAEASSQPEETGRTEETTPIETTPMETTTAETTKELETGTPEQTSEPSSEKETQKPAESTKPTEKPTESTKAPENGEVITLVFENITSADKASRILYDAGVIQSIENFNAYLSENGLAGKVGEGEFQFTKGMTFEEIADIITRRR